MPLYEYECEGGHKFEGLKSMSDRHNCVCPYCDKPPRLLISQLARRNFFDKRISLTVLKSDGTVVGKRFDHRPTPYPEEYYNLRRIREDQMADAYAEGVKM